MPIMPVVQPLFSAVIKSVIAAANRLRWAYNFDGVDDYGVLDQRAVDIQNDNTFEFWSPEIFTGTARTIIAQTWQSNISLREFELFTGSDNFLIMVRGGVRTQLMTNAQGYKVSTLYGIRQTGDTIEIFEGGLSGQIVRTLTAPKGAATEPTALTTVCCRGNTGNTFISFHRGKQYNVRINGVLWEMRNNSSAVQPSIPAGNNMTLFNTTSDRWQEVSQ